MQGSVLDRPDAQGGAGLDFEDFFENGSVGLHLVDRHGVILRANRAELEMMGYAADEYVGRRVADFHVDAEVVADILRRLSIGERLHRYPARLKTKDGSIRHVEISSSVLFRDGEFINSRCFSIDVTATRAAEAARLEAERRLAATYESVTVGIGETDARGRFLRVNPAFSAITGYSAEELLEMSFEQLTHPDDRTQDRLLYEAQVAGQKDCYSVDKRYVRKDGVVIEVEVLSSCVKGPDGGFRYGVRVVKDVTEEKQAAARLRESERRARELLKAMPMAVYTTDTEGRVTYFNEAAEVLAGRRPIVGEDRWCVTWQLRWPDDRPLPHEACPMAIALKEGRELRGVEAVAVRPDGETRTFMPHPTLLRDERGEVIGGLNVLVDITARKRAEDGQKVLIDELNHRVKNTLATVQSIAFHTQRSSPESFAERFEDRLMALAKAHDLLTRRSWTGASLRELLDQELVPYVDRVEGGLALDGPDVELPATLALPLGMVIHELATNAAKYGALSSAGGRVAVSWAVERGDEGSRLEMRWSETGGPPVSPPTRIGFGRRLIERNVAKDLAGDADLRFAPEGLQARFSLPLP